MEGHRAGSPPHFPWLRHSLSPDPFDRAQRDRLLLHRRFAALLARATHCAVSIPKRRGSPAPSRLVCLEGEDSFGSW